MKIYKKLNSDFTVTSNEIFRHNLSFKAIGLYLYIVSKPDGWEFSVAGCMKQVQDGKDSIRSGLRELEAVGFLQRKQARGGGKFAGYDWEVADKPLAGNPPSEKPSTGKPPQVSTDTAKTKEVSTKQSPTEIGAVAPAKGGIIKKITNHGSVVDGSRARTPKSELGSTPAPQFGNAFINELVDLLKEKMEIPMLDDTPARNRNYCWNLMRKFGKGPDGKFLPELGRDKVRIIIETAARSDRFKYKMTSFSKLWFNAVSIISSVRDQRGGVTTLER